MEYARTLPAVSKKRVQSASPRTDSSASRKLSGKMPDIRHVSCLQWEKWKQGTIRQGVTTLSRRDTACHRNSFLHNMSISLLVAGFHKTFEEIFWLVEKRKKDRLEAGVDSILWEAPLLEEQTDKLSMLRTHLTQAETATRNGKWETVYNAHNHLASYFLQSDDGWLADYFYKSALDISTKICLDGRKKEAEALYHMGLVCERNDDIENACYYMDECYQLSVGRTWTDDQENNLGQSACHHLSRLYSALADRADGPAASLPILKRALEVAKEAEEDLQVANAALKMGVSCYKLGDTEMAKQYLSESFTHAKNAGSDPHLGRACAALARCFYEQGNLPECVEFLRLYVDTFQSNEDREEFVKACTTLGMVYNLTGEYGKAADLFRSAYDESNTIMRKDEQCLVQLGVARGNVMMSSFMRNLEYPQSVMMARVVDWKDYRGKKFVEHLPGGAGANNGIKTSHRHSDPVIEHKRTEETTKHRHTIA